MFNSSQGIGVVLCETSKAAETVIEEFLGLDEQVIVQECIKQAGGTNIRSIVVIDKVVDFIEKTQSRARNNARGGG